MFNELIDLIHSIYGEGNVALHAPVLTDDDRKGVLEAIDCGFVSSVGPHVNQFEDDLSRFTGSKKTVAVMNGTAALHLALILSGVKKDDLVLTQGLTFIATANAISYIGASPVFLDSDEQNLGLCPLALRRFLELEAVLKDGKTIHKATGKKITACVPMHVFGHPVHIEQILEICNEWKIAVVEDAAESLGSQIGAKHTGTFAPIGILSFNGNKIITTGGGGALLFQDEQLALRAKHLSTTAKRPHKWEFYHDEIGFNYRLPNLNAALGCAQLKRLDHFLVKKRTIAKRYAEFFSSHSDIKFISGRPDATPNWWLNAIILKDRGTRDGWLQELNSKGLMSRPVWELMTDLPMYKNCINDGLKTGRFIVERLVNLPSGVPL
jgi:aminotransferase in exopolysaccharide biosynthesis